MDLTIESAVTDDGIVVLTLSGSLDLTTAPRLRDHSTRLIGEGRHRLVLGLGAVDLVDSIGLGVIVGLVHRLRPHDGLLAIAAPSPQARKVLEITQVIRLISTHDTTEGAVSAVRSGSAVVSARPRTDE